MPDLRTENQPWLDIQGWFSQADASVYQSLVRRAAQGPGALGRMLEVGVWKGRSLACILPTALELGYTYIGAVDTWQGSPSELATTHAEAADGLLLATFEAEMDRRGWLSAISVQEGESVLIATDHEDASLDLVFIDGEHTAESVRADVLAWLPKVRPGGILAGHDIGWQAVRRGLSAAGLSWERDRRRDDSSIWLHPVPAA